MNKPDPELSAWIESLMDQRIEPADAQRLAERLRDDPEAMRYCAEVIRFDAAMQDELCPQEIEWTDTRKLTLKKQDGGSGLQVERNQSVRYGNMGSDTIPANNPPARSMRSRWWAGIIIAALLAGGAVFSIVRKPATPGAGASRLALLNADFEATDLTYLTEPSNRALVDWQDYFVTENAEVVEISRVTNGKVLPKSGRNVARLSNYAYLTQRLRRADGSPLLAEPGLRIVVSGWAQVLDAPATPDGALDRENPASGEDESAKPLALRGALRFVAGGSPGMVQYEAVGETVTLKMGDWQPFRIMLGLPEDLELPASHGVSRTKLDLTGKPLTLSLDSLCNHRHQLLLDHLKIEEIR